MDITRIGIDLAKQVFQIHGVGRDGKTLVKKQLRRSQMMPYFSELPPTLVGMEACGSAHYWARELRKMGHDTRLMSPQFVKPYVKSGKNDANDACPVQPSNARLVTSRKSMGSDSIDC